MAYDDKLRYILVGGTVKEPENDAQDQQTGFLYALNFNGDWMWSYSFYSETSRIQSINQCIMTDDRTTLLVHGLQDNNPVIFEVDPYSGAMKSQINIDTDLLILDHIKTGGVFVQNYERGLKTYFSAFLFDRKL